MIMMIMIMMVLVLIMLFSINDAKLHVPVVTLSAKDNQKLSKLLSNGFKRMCIGMIIKQKVRMKV